MGDFRSGEGGVLTASTLTLRNSTISGLRAGNAAMHTDYTGKQLPLAPLAFKIAADDRLRCEVEIGQLRPTLHYKCAILLKMLPKFALVRSFLLQNNVQEYLFKFE